MTSDAYVLGRNLNPKYSTYGSWVLKTDGENINKSIKALGCLLNTTRYENALSPLALWGIGSPTVEMFMASYNATHTDEMHEFDNRVISQQLYCRVNSNSTGYDYSTDMVNWTGLIELGQTSDLDKAIYAGWEYWDWFLSSPSAASPDYLAGVHKSTTYNGFLGGAGLNASFDELASGRILVAVPISVVGFPGENKDLTITENYF